MGYYSELSGEMTFSRVLNRAEVAKLKEPMGDDWNVYKLVTALEERETDEGTLTITRNTGLDLLFESGVKAYEWQRVLQSIIDALPVDVTVSGYFERSGEEAPDLERLYVVGRTVVSVTPQIVWPDPNQAPVADSGSTER